MKRFIAQPTGYLDQFRRIVPQAVIFIFAISALLIYRIGLEETATLRLVLVPAIVFMLVLTGVAVFVYLKSRTLNAFVIEISSDRIRRVRENSPVVEILRDDIKEIRLTARGDLWVHGRGLRDRIMIPVEMQDREDLLDQLSELAKDLPPRERGKVFLIRIILIPVIILAVYAIIGYWRYGTVDPLLETAISGLLCLALLARVVIVWLSKQSAWSVKLMEFLLLVPVFFFLYRIWQIWN